LGFGASQKNTASVEIQVARICKGDFDEDGDVDETDLAAFAAEFGRTDCPNCP
jgi:hypothetical protein